MMVHAWTFFSGRYLPYIDWSNHVGLISILAHGGETGALAYAERSFAPTPYFLFYGVAALVAQLVPVPVAAKCCLLISTALATYGASYLAEISGRSPRLGLIAPLALFGYSLGYGFGAFVFTLPLVLFALAAGESLLGTLDTDASAFSLVGRVATFAGLLALVYLGHGLWFLLTVFLLSGRFLVAFVARITGAPRVAGRLVAASLAAVVPVALLAFPLLFAYLDAPWAEGVGGGAGPGSIARFEEQPLTWTKIGGHLLERGSERHWLTMRLSFGLLLVWLVLSVFRAHPRKPSRYGLEIYAVLLSVAYLFGPISLERPFQIWMVYPRFATLAALVLFLLPRCDLSRWRVVFVIPALVLITLNASINRSSIVTFSRWAEHYDPVRERIPQGVRVLALTDRKAGDLAGAHHAMGSLFFYHLADGSAYTAFLFDNPLHPVRLKKSGRPRAPPWNQTYAYNPRVHGIDFDYLVLRGSPFVERTQAAGLHELVAEVNGWWIFKTNHPTPRPPIPQG